MTAAPVTIRPAFAFTRHAVDRYVERLHDGKCTDARALQELAAAAHVAEPMSRPSWHGNPMWCVIAPPMRWIAVAENGCAVVITVLSGADEGIEAERTEYEALMVRRRLALIPQIGRSEATSPVPRGDAEYRLWVGLESRRLEVERKRLAALRDALMTPRERMARIRETRGERRVKREEGQARALAEQQLAIMWRNDLIEAMAARLADVDPVGSADLIERARTRVAKWESEGRVAAQDEERVNG